MPARMFQIAVWGLLLFAPSPAPACETVTGEAGGSALHTRKPVRGDDVRLVSGFGMQKHPILMVPRLHTGIDWASPTGTPVIAAGGGRVVFAGRKGEYGNAVFIDHGAGWQTIYAHLASMTVRENDCVAALIVIGRSGATGLTTGPMMHFEVQQGGQPIDPMQLPFKEPTPPPEAK